MNPDGVTQVRVALARMLSEGSVREVRAAGFLGFSDQSSAEFPSSPIVIITIAGRNSQAYWAEVYQLIGDAGVHGVLWQLEPENAEPIGPRESAHQIGPDAP